MTPSPKELPSWEQLYHEQWPILVRSLVALFGTREGVEDAIQDAFAIALTRRVDEFQSPHAWLYIVARNRMHQKHRRQRLARLLGALSSVQSASIDDEITRIDTIRALNQLSHRDRELLIAKYYLGFTQEEIAGYLHVPRGTISSAIARAAQRFREVEQRDRPNR